MKWLVPLTFLLTASSPALAYLGGEVPRAERYPAFKIQFSGSTSLAHGEVDLCSGVLVLPDLILTAAHCVTGPARTQSPNVLLNRGGLTQIPALIQAVYLPPDTARRFKEMESTHAESPGLLLSCEVPDLALIRLTGPVVGLPVVPIEREVPQRWGTRLWVGGFGKQKSNETIPETLSNGLRGSRARYVKSKGTCFTADVFHGAMSLGDSGGPVFFRHADGRLTVFGVNTYVDSMSVLGFYLYKEQGFVRLDDESPTQVRISDWMRDVFTGRAVADYLFSTRSDFNTSIR